MANIEREQLEKKTVSDLRVIARQLGIKRVDSFKKVDLIDLILKQSMPENDGEVGDLFVALNDGDNQTWTHVPSGYAPGLEALTGVNNQIIMTNHSGTTVGQISVAAAEGSSITASVANNALTIGMEWGSF